MCCAVARKTRQGMRRHRDLPSQRCADLLRPTGWGRRAHWLLGSPLWCSRSRRRSPCWCTAFDARSYYALTRAEVLRPRRVRSKVQQVAVVRVPAGLMRGCRSCWKHVRLLWLATGVCPKSQAHRQSGGSAGGRSAGRRAAASASAATNAGGHGVTIGQWQRALRPGRSFRARFQDVIVARAFCRPLRAAVSRVGAPVRESARVCMCVQVRIRYAKVFTSHMSRSTRSSYNSACLVRSAAPCD